MNKYKIILSVSYSCCFVGYFLFLHIQIFITQNEWTVWFKFFQKTALWSCTYSCYWPLRKLFFWITENSIVLQMVGFSHSNLFIPFLQLKMQVNMFLYFMLIHSDFYKKQMFWVPNLNYIVKKHPFTDFFLPCPSLTF